MKNNTVKLSDTTRKEWVIAEKNKDEKDPSLGESVAERPWNNIVSEVLLFFLFFKFNNL